MRLWTEESSDNKHGHRYLKSGAPRSPKFPNNTQCYFHYKLDECEPVTCKTLSYFTCMTSTLRTCVGWMATHSSTPSVKVRL